ncbi:2-amino-4-hydroxy-6-hydroxymethyldihydropteridine diphosphokinase [Alphaproteobacteria bacterium]|nr:2-amino-4-hydroxy-6-hydroxymethyldihydropteridine diphosphokinase [Alphaproteobacteria bacterium]
MYPTNYYIALGTNVGNYINNFSNAILELKKIGQVVKMAHIYKSKPYGYLKQNFFYNTMVHLKSEILSIELINKIQLIERKLKKNKRIINGPRRIDLDIIFWDHKIIKIQELSIPHPRASERDFVLLPMQDIVQNFRDPVSKLTIKELILRLKNYYIIERLSYRNLL